MAGSTPQIVSISQLVQTITEIVIQSLENIYFAPLKDVSSDEIWWTQQNRQPLLRVLIRRWLSQLWAEMNQHPDKLSFQRVEQLRQILAVSMTELMEYLCTITVVAHTQMIKASQNISPPQKALTIVGQALQQTLFNTYTND